MNFFNKKTYNEMKISYLSPGYEIIKNHSSDRTYISFCAWVVKK